MPSPSSNAPRSVSPQSVAILPLALYFQGLRRWALRLYIDVLLWLLIMSTSLCIDSH